MLKPQRSLRPKVLRSSHEENGRGIQSSHLERTLGALLGAGANLKHTGKGKESKRVGEQHLTSWGLCKHADGCLNQWQLQGNPEWQFRPS